MTLLLTLAFLLLLIIGWSALVVSGRCSDEERKRDEF